MRIIAGNLGGRTFHEPLGHKTHPMSEKARGALFNTLGDVEGLTFIDAFAGSGALSFEAISRGAKSAVAVEKDRSAFDALAKNIKELSLAEQIKASRANIGGWSIHNMEKKFDILLLDPPYNDLQLSLLERLVKRHLGIGGLAALSYPGGQKPPMFEKTQIVHSKKYGDAQLVFYRKTA